MRCFLIVAGVLALLVLAADVRAFSRTATQSDAERLIEFAIMFGIVSAAVDYCLTLPVTNRRDVAKVIRVYALSDLPAVRESFYTARERTKRAIAMDPEMHCLKIAEDYPEFFEEKSE